MISKKIFLFCQNMYQNLVSMTINCHLITWEYSLHLILSEGISWRSLTVTEHILVRRFRPAFDYTLVETLDLNKTIDGLLEWGRGLYPKHHSMDGKRKIMVGINFYMINDAILINKPASWNSFNLVNERYWCHVGFKMVAFFFLRKGIYIINHG